MLELEQIRLDGGTQSRVELNQDTVAEYRQAFMDGAVFPPVVVFFDGANYWLADGFHRYFGARDAGESALHAEIINGTQRDALLYSLKANATHGLKRTNADKRKAIETLLKDTEWSQWSDRKIAEVCGVGNQMVGDVRRSICVNHTDVTTTRTVERNGKTYTQNTANIGKKPVESDSAKSKPAPKPAPAKEAEPEEIPQDDGPSAEELAAMEAAEEADRALVATMLESDDALAALAEENKRLKAEVAQLKLARDGYMNRCNEAIALVKARDRQIAKLEKMLKDAA